MLTTSNADRLTRTARIGIVCAVAWAASSLSGDARAAEARTPRAAKSERPNIVLVMADDQGWGDMAYYGHPRLKTPHFDRSAATGLRFDRFYAAAPVCSPTRASVMTGRHPNRMGVFKWGYPMRPQETTIAEALQTAGYATAHFGKWHLGSVRRTSPAHPGRNGFDEWLSAPNFFDNDAILSHRGKAVQTSGESSIVTADAAVDWITQQSQTEHPFLCVVWFGSPHSPHRSTAEFSKHYASESAALKNFYGEITGMDAAYGKLKKTLHDLNVADNTVLWYCSDNGALPKVGSTGGHRANKGKVYEGGLLVPSILEWPARIPKPQVTTARCNTCDIYPTLLDIAGVKIEHQAPLDGVSLVDVIDGKRNQRQRGMGFWDYPARGISTPSDKWMSDLLEAQQAGGDLEPHESSQRAAELPNPPFPNSTFPGHSAWIDGDWKLHRIEDKQKNVTWELYNLAEDRAETTNLLSAQSDRVTRMKSDLHDWLKSVVGSLNGEDYSRR